MKKFISTEKLSKKAQQELNRKERGSWNGVNPITRKTENRKLYNRKKVQHGDDYFSNVEPFSLNCVTFNSSNFNLLPNI